MDGFRDSDRVKTVGRSEEDSSAEHVPSVPPAVNVHTPTDSVLGGFPVCVCVCARVRENVGGG